MKLRLKEAPMSKVVLHGLAFGAAVLAGFALVAFFKADFTWDWPFVLGSVAGSVAAGIALAFSSIKSRSE